MPIRKRFEAREPTEYYGMVEQVISADSNSRYSRQFICLDCVVAPSFRERGPEALRDRGALALVRAMSTPARLEKLFGLSKITEGDWVAFELDDSGGTPRAWELRADADYVAGPSRSIRSMRLISGDPGSTAPSDIARCVDLSAATAMLVKSRPRVHASKLARRFRPRGDIEIVVLDVGQASANLIKRDGVPIGLFDVGAPLWFNTGSLPKSFVPPVIKNGFVFLSHWDFDHFDLGRRHLAYRSLDWYAPDQPVGPNTARFQEDLGDRLYFVTGHAGASGFSWSQGSSADPKDRNGSGYQLRYATPARAVLLTGDAPYNLVQPSMLVGLNGVTVPHHGGHSTAPPPVAAKGDAIVSYGRPNSYRHPHDATIQAHQSNGWEIRSTAAHGHRRRGNRTLFS